MRLILFGLILVGLGLITKSVVDLQTSLRSVASRDLKGKWQLMTASFFVLGVLYVTMLVFNVVEGSDDTNLGEDAIVAVTMLLIGVFVFGLARLSKSIITELSPPV